MNRKANSASVLFTLLGLIVVNGNGCVVRHQAPSQTLSLVIRHVTVVDVINGRLDEDRDVLIDGDRIVRVIRAGSSDVPGGPAIDARGMFVIPGLWDMHTHLGSYDDAKRVLPILLASGVTGVRDMGSPADDILRLRDDVRHRRLDGPRIVATGPLFNGPLPFHIPLIVSVTTPAETIHAADSLMSLGVDFLKVHDALGRDAYFALSDVARRRGVPLVGHIPISITALEAVRAGQRSIEHLGGRFYGEMLAVSSREVELRGVVDTVAAAALRDLWAGREPRDDALFRSPLTDALVASFSAEAERRLISELLAQGTWQVPTFAAQPLLSALQDTSLHLSDADRANGRRLIALQMHVIRDMSTAGVGVMAGTDRPIASGNLVDELDAFVQAGFSPAEALRASTSEPARFLRATDSLGVVAAGHVADLVILSADPLKSVAALRSPAVVILAGKVVARR